MAQIQFWGNSFNQLRGLPAPIRAVFARAILSLSLDETLEPESEADDMFTEAMRGPEGLFRISVGASRSPPGYRAVYFVHERRVYFIRFRSRDPTSYQGLRKDLGRLKSELRELG